MASCNWRSSPRTPNTLRPALLVRRARNGREPDQRKLRDPDDRLPRQFVANDLASRLLRCRSGSVQLNHAAQVIATQAIVDAVKDHEAVISSNLRVFHVDRSGNQ